LEEKTKAEVSEATTETQTPAQEATDVSPSQVEETEAQPEKTNNEVQPETSEAEANDAPAEEVVGLTETLEDEETPTDAEQETPTTEDAPADEKAPTIPATKEEALNELKKCAQDADNASRQDIDNLKQVFYKLHNAEVEAAKLAFVEGGGAEEEFVPADDPVETEFKRLMAIIRDKRSKQSADLERRKEENLQVKLSIIEELKELVESGEDTNKSYVEFRKLQQQWNETNPVPQGKVNELWKNYQLQVEKFYDLLKINNELREYDFKKNLEIKTRICETAEKLAADEDIVTAFHQLQKLHQEYRDAGPIAKELRAALWSRFKTASAIINRRHQQHFELLKATEQHNLDQKTVICEIVETIEFDKLKSFSAWDSKTKEVIALQNKWKTIGFAPHKMNVKIFERFRRACDEFFKRKAAFFKSLKDEMNENLTKKKELCEKAEALKDSTDWKTTAEELSKLQKEWKAIGPVSRRHSDAVWKRFIAACDYFFEKKNKNTSSNRSSEIDNLRRKKAIIQKLDEIDDEMDADEASEQARALMNEWNNTGHVPFKEKDKILKQYTDRVERVTSRLHISAPRRPNAQRSNSGVGQESGQTPFRERERLTRTYESMKSELQTYENNIGFLTSSSKKGSSLVDEMNRKVEKLKTELEQMKAKIKALDDSMREAEEATAATSEE
jgi:hypothetical protein